MVCLATKHLVSRPFQQKAGSQGQISTALYSAKSSPQRAHSGAHLGCSVPGHRDSPKRTHHACQPLAHQHTKTNTTEGTRQIGWGLWFRITRLSLSSAIRTSYYLGQATCKITVCNKSSASYFLGRNCTYFLLFYIKSRCAPRTFVASLRSVCTFLLLAQFSKLQHSQASPAKQTLSGQLPNTQVCDADWVKFAFSGFCTIPSG